MTQAAKVLARFVRQAGLLKVPPKLYAEIQEWVEAAYESRDSAKKPKASFSKKWAINEDLLSGWRYGDQLKARFPEAWKDALNLDLAITLTFKAKAGNIGGRATGVRKIELFDSQNSTKPESTLGTLEHELMHWTQHFMAGVLAKAGVDDVQPGVPSERMLNKDVSQNDKGNKYDKHRLDDLEFYTLLKDEVRKFDRYFRYVLKQDEKFRAKEEFYEDAEGAPGEKAYLRDNVTKILRMYTRVDRKANIPRFLTTMVETLGQSLFDVLYKHNEEKWRKAVGIFMHALEPWTHKSAWD